MHLKNKISQNFVRVSLILLCGLFSFSNTSALIFTTSENEINSDNFIINADGAASDYVDLDFGESLTARFRYDIVADKFVINENLDLENNQLLNTRVQNLSAPPSACAVSTRGLIYFDIEDALTYICDGSIWNPIENALGSTVAFPVVQARRTTTYTLTETFTDIDLDITDQENNTTILDHDNTLRDRINIGESGLYQIIYGYTSGGTSTGTHEARARVRVNDTTVLEGSQSVNRNYQVEFSTTSASFLATLTSGDYLSLQLDRDATADTTQDDIFFSVVKLEGLKGDKGDKGDAGAAGADGADGTNGTDGINGADGDIVWKGTWVSQNYIVHDTVEYQGSTYTCKLNTVSSEIPTNTTYWDLVASKGDSGAGSPETDSNTFTIDADDTGGNINLVFGTTLAETLTWNDGQSRFDLSDTLRVSGNLEQDGNSLALDTDNTGIGADVDIVANQGSDNDGTLRYNATTNQWEFSNDGGAFNSIFIPQVFDAYDNAGGTALSETQSVLNIDTTRVSDSNYTLASDIVTINKDGLYRLSGELSVETLNTSGTQRGGIEMQFQTDTGSGFTDVPGTFCKEYMREQNLELGGAACSVSWLGSFTSGDKIQITHRKNGTTNSQTIAGGSRLAIEFIR